MHNLSTHSPGLAVVVVDQGQVKEARREAGATSAWPSRTSFDLHCVQEGMKTDRRRDVVHLTLFFVWLVMKVGPGRFGGNASGRTLGFTTNQAGDESVHTVASRAGKGAKVLVGEGKILRASRGHQIQGLVGQAQAEQASFPGVVGIIRIEEECRKSNQQAIRDLVY